MSKELSALERAFKNAEREFHRVSQKTLKSLDRETKKATRELQQARKKAERYKNDLVKKSEKLAKTTAANAKRQLRTQINKLDKLLNAAMDEVESHRINLAPLREQLKHARAYAMKATRISKAVGKTEQELEKKAGGKTATSFLDANPALRNTLAQIEKEFGEGSIMPLGADAQRPIEGISSGSLSVDLALGGKGFPRGRIIE